MFKYEIITKPITNKKNFKTNNFYLRNTLKIIEIKIEMFCLVILSLVIRMKSREIRVKQYRVLETE